MKISLSLKNEKIKVFVKKERLICQFRDNSEEEVVEAEDFFHRHGVRLFLETKKSLYLFHRKIHFGNGDSITFETSILRTWLKLFFIFVLVLGFWFFYQKKPKAKEISRFQSYIASPVLSSMKVKRIDYKSTYVLGTILKEQYICSFSFRNTGDAGKVTVRAVFNRREGKHVQLAYSKAKTFWVEENGKIESYITSDWIKAGKVTCLVFAETEAVFLKH